MSNIAFYYDEPQIIFSLMLLVAAIVIGFGMHWFYKVIRQVEKEMSGPIHRTYRIAISRFPDALILKFGLDMQFREVPAGINLHFVPWGLIDEHLDSELATVIYCNKRVAGAAIEKNAQITTREKVLCGYRGLAICVRLQSVTAKTTSVHQPQGRDYLRSILEQGSLLVQKGTDQERALQELMNGLSLDHDKHICRLSPGADILEAILEPPEADQEKGGACEIKPVIGFVGGITERVIAEKIGFTVIAEHHDITDHDEVNVLVYNRSQNPVEQADLVYALGEVEEIWDETVAKISADVTMRSRFRTFLNDELRTQVGVHAIAALGGNDIFTESDMDALLERWLVFEKPTAK